MTACDRILSRLDRPIVLVGLMASGKTFIGGMLARALDLEFIDMDREIAEAAGLSVAGIFATHGERYFRDRESEVLRRLLQDDRCARVISTGGGAPVRPENAEIIFSRAALSVWLKADIPVLLRRAGGMAGGMESRPLLHGENPEKALRDMAILREPVYRRADMTIDSGGEANDVLKTLLTGIEGALDQ